MRYDTYGAELSSSSSAGSPEQDPLTGSGEYQTHLEAANRAGQPAPQSSAEQGTLPVGQVDWLGLEPELQAGAVLGSQASETGQPNAEGIFPAPPSAIGAGPEMCQVCGDAIMPTDARVRCRWETTSTVRHCGCTVHLACFITGRRQCFNCLHQDLDEFLDEFAEKLEAG